MLENDKDSFEERLKNVIESVDAATVLTSPLIDSIENLLNVSAASFNSEEASVLIRDGNSGDLRFLCAIGKVADQLIDLKIPSGKGIAGFVFSSGQPMTISNAGQEESFYAEVDKKTGFSTETILATPLQFDGTIIGVLEYVNRIGEPPYKAFSPDEMDRAAIYAETVSSLVNAYESATIFKLLGKKMLSETEVSNLKEIRNWIDNLRDTNDHKDMIDLAILVRELAMRGKVERKLCREILESILNYSDNNTDIKFSSL